LNRNLLVFALLLLLFGIGSGFYFLSFLGLLLLVPSLISSSRPPRRPSPPPARKEVRRISPPPIQQPQVTTQVTQPKPEVMPVSSPQSPGYSSALFPTSMLPPISQLGTIIQPTKETAQRKPEERDELLEVGVILALVKLALG
jgi:hypothetical protein